MLDCNSITHKSKLYEQKYITSNQKEYATVAVV